MPSAVFVVPPEFEELELVAPVDVLRRAGVHVRVLSQADSVVIEGRNGLRLHADERLQGTPRADLLVFPGGPGVRHLRADPRCADLARDFADAGLWVAAICAAPLLLSDAGLLQGRRFTAHPSTRDELPGSSGEPVVRDGPIITARGAGVSLLFGLQLVDILCGKQSADSVAASICV